MSKTLWIFGDSYADTSLFDHDRVWINQLAKKLNYKLKNLSMLGCSQDFPCQMLADHASDISQDDQIIIVSTSPGRFWFFEDLPEITNPNVIFTNTKNTEKLLGKDRARVAEMYFKYLQRPQLDILHSTLRLGWLNHMAVTHGWKPPLIIFGFFQFTLSCSKYPNLILSNGNLTDNISEPEVEPNGHLFKGSDPRYNHLCLRNHDVLSNKIYNTLVDNQSLDLTQGFHAKLISKKSLHDNEWANEELCVPAYLKFKNGYK
jgi:hypothetical protein